MTMLKRIPTLVAVVLSSALWLPASPGNSAAPALPADGASTKSTSAITVRIEALRNDRGTVYVSLHASKKSFDDGKGGLKDAQARPKQGTAVVVFENVVPGKYALSFIHDENDNKKLDTSFIGIPKEGFGFSKDVMGRFGAPKFDDAALTIPPGATTVVMHTKYM